MTQDYREWAYEQHLNFANFAMRQCWVNGLDAIVFDKKQLIDIIGLKTLEIPYVALIRDDIAKLFPYSFFTYLENNLLSLFISRINFPHMPEQPMDDNKRIQYLKDSHLKIDKFYTVEEDVDYNHVSPLPRQRHLTSENTDTNIEDMNENEEISSPYKDNYYEDDYGENEVWGAADWADFFGCDEDELESAWENQSYHDN